MDKLSGKAHYIKNLLKAQQAAGKGVGSSNKTIDKMLKSQLRGQERGAMSAAGFPVLAERLNPGNAHAIGPRKRSIMGKLEDMVAPLRDNPSGLTGRDRLVAKNKARKLRRNVGYGAAGAAGAAALAGGGYALRKALKSRAAKAALRKRLAIGGGVAAGAGGLGAALAYRKRA